MSKVVVTGAGGFIGAYLTRSLLAQGHSVVAVDNYIRGMPSRLDGLEGDAERVDLDVRDKDGLVSLLKGVDAVFHLAAVNGTENFYNRPELRSEEHTSELQSLMRISYAVFCLKKKKVRT